ncbi:MAG TPA: DUF222 domain-containing protein [Streptosporangiaceae bacterium]|nr:DUF222 domain-containing protein [Streptosporangiaceae bacterium]
MKSTQQAGPGPDGEEHSSSPSSSPRPGQGPSGTGRGPSGTGQVPDRPAEAAGFADGGAADVMAPGAVLAGLVTAVTGPDGSVLGTLTDEEVLGVLGAVQRLAAWAAWGELVALAEFLRRRPGALAGSAGARVAAEEAAWKTGESWARMLDQATLAVTVAARLPHTLAAMGQGLISGYKVRIIEAQTADLSAEDVAKADVMLAAAGQVKNPGGLRDFARRQVARLDPEAAVRKKDRGRRNAYVRAFQEDSGNMGLSARELPNADGQIAWQNIERRALDLHAAGVEGSAGQLQVQAMLDFLLGRAAPCQSGACQGAHRDDDEGAWQDAHHDEDQGACQDAHPKNGRGGGRGGWAVNPVLVVPWDPARGCPSGAAELPGYGLLDQDDTMDLLHAAGQHPASRWCLTATGPDGTATAHACLPGPRTLDAIRTASQASGMAGAAGLAAALKVRLEPVTRGACDHAQAEPQYRPSRKLRHLVMARSTRCVAPGCGSPATACDQDHTREWEDGGITCQCNLAALCRRHHQIKQAQGWKLEQPEPGILVWITPAGLIRVTTPTSYQD